MAFLHRKHSLRLTLVLRCKCMPKTIWARRSRSFWVGQISPTSRTFLPASVMNYLAHRLISSSALLLLIFTGCGSPASKPANRTASPDLRYDFALIGDVPYNEMQATNLFPNMIEELNHARLAFVVHDGDIKSGSAPCTDEAFQRVFTQFQTSQHPFVYLFGDNEWSDCGKVKTNAFDPLERLQKLRDLFTQGDESLGQRKLALTRQSSEPPFAVFRENVRWTYGGVMFAGLNVPGDDNHFGTPEFGPRNTANIAWIQEAFAIATRENLRAVMLIMQANPHFELAATNQLRRGF